MGAAASPSQVFLGMTSIIASEPMRELMALVERVARSNATVLIQGESGVGKEMIARAVHFYSRRGHRPWVDLSCAALPENLLESELFGHERGAFSGADRPKAGLFEMACEGSIFLDEIGELDPRMQVKLLRVLDGVPYYRLGGVRKVDVDVRVIAATNRNLEQAVKEGRFRGDLYHRLSQFTITVPPLRERVADIEPLARHFLAEHDPAMELGADAAALLREHDWPGNIRELRNAVTQAAVLAHNGVLGPRDFNFRMGRDLQALHGAWAGQPRFDSEDTGEEAAAAASFGADSRDGAVPRHAASHAPPGAANGCSLEEMERRLIFDALRSTGGHQQKAAARLGISRRTLSRKLKQYQTDPGQRAGVA